MSSPHASIEDLWRWFEAHRSQFDALTDSGDPFWDEAIGRLKLLDARLRFELSHPDGSDREFIITAEGHRDAFPLVEAIVARAPRLAGWRFIALKPPMGFDFTTTYDDVRLDPRAMWFLPLDSSARPHDLGIRVGVPNFSTAIERQARNAVEVILETSLGERAAALDIQHVEVCALPDSPEASGNIELDELPGYIEWRKRQRQDA